MRHNAREWLLAREKDAAPRLDSIRRAALAPRRAAFLDCALEVFRPHLRAWAALALVWILLAVAQASIPRRPQGGWPRTDSAFLAAADNEKLPALDSRN